MYVLNHIRKTSQKKLSDMPDQRKYATPFSGPHRLFDEPLML